MDKISILKRGKGISMMNPGLEKTVAVRSAKTPGYPSKMPFDPPDHYPEIGKGNVDPENSVFTAVREAIADLGLDPANYGTPRWNPFSDFIKPGMTVFIKPNTVVHEHEKRKNLFSILVHPSVIRPILDYACKALQSRGKIIIGDSQLYSSNYEKMLLTSGLGDLLNWYQPRTEVDILWFDLRLNKATRTWLYGLWSRKKVENDPLGYQFVDLGTDSCFRDVDPARLRIAIASYRNMFKHHSGGKHEYLFPKSFLASDVVINIAKLKTHRRTAVTLALKNYMGLPAYKDSLPHFMIGSPEEGGDQYIHPSKRKRIITRLHDCVQTARFVPVKFVCAVINKLLLNSCRVFPFKDNVFEAMWWGNDTVWRTLHDLNRAVVYADKDGVIREAPQRRQFALIDGIIGGEGDGPLACDPVPAGVVVGGFNPVCVDAVAATVMGFDTKKIPLIDKALADDSHRLSLLRGGTRGLTVIDNGKEEGFEDFIARPHLDFKPHPQWSGHVERPGRA